MPILKQCARHGLYEPGNPSIPRGRCPRCYQEHNDLRGWRRRRQVQSGWEWGRIREKVHRRDRVCVVCGGRDRLEVHHIKPLARRGTNHLDNLELRCHDHYTHSPARPQDAANAHPFL